MGPSEGRGGFGGLGVLRFSARQGMRLINEVAARLSYLAKFAQVYAAEKVDNSIVEEEVKRSETVRTLMRGPIGCESTLTDKNVISFSIVQIKENADDWSWNLFYIRLLDLYELWLQNNYWNAQITIRYKTYIVNWDDFSYLLLK